jgi:CzcA family heavy metal efflux pump
VVERLIRWSLERRALIVVLSLLVLALGAWTTARMPVDVFPDLTAPTVTVLVESEGFAPDEMERLVTFPIEAAVNGANDVRRVRSASSLGIAIVWIEFQWGTDIHRARQTVAERLSTVASSLPRGVRTPKLAPQSSILGEILFVALTSDRHDQLELRRIGTTVVRRRILSEPGVAQVVPIGGETRQYQVVLSPELLRSFDVTTEDVVRALERANENVSGGLLVRADEESIVQGIGRIDTVADIARAVVTVKGTRAVLVGDLGRVEIGAALRRGTAAAARRAPDGTGIVEPAVVFGITKQPGVNTLELTRRLDTSIAAIQASLPDGMVLNAQLFRQSSFISNAVRNTVTALLEGGVMVILVVLLFLASARASLITLLAIPMSLAIAILALRLLGGDINTMTLGGMAIAIGALVDDAIIDVENVVRRLRENALLPQADRRSAFAIVFDASVEVRASIVFATAIILMVFSPIFALSGVEGRLLQPLGIAFCVGLAASLLTALTLTPAMCLWLLPNSPTVRTGREPRVVHWIKSAYARPLGWSLRHPWLVIVPSVILFVWSLFAVSRAGRNFLPEFNEGAFVLGVTTGPGTSLAASDGLAGRVESILMQHDEVVAIGRRTGRAEEDEHVLGVEASELEITLDMQAPARKGKPVRTKAELLAALRQDLAVVPGIQATFGQPISHRVDHMLSGSRASVAVKIFGADLDTLRSLARDVEGAMKGVAGVVDLSIEPQVDVPAMRVEIDRDALARHGLDVDEVNAAILAVTKGIAATQVLENAEAYDIVVRLGEARAVTLELLAATSVLTPRGEQIPLSLLTHLREDSTPNFISRENAERRIVVQCNVAGRDVTGLVEDVQAAIATRVTFPRGYWVQYGGQFESAQETSQRLAILGILVIAAMAGLLVWVLGSVRDAGLVLLNLPLALIGGVAGLVFSGGVLSVASLIGFITVFGVAARNGILLVSHVRHLQRFEGVTDFVVAVRRGSLERVAPILMTALAAGLALVPLALRGEEPGSELLTPMAIVILSGLFSSTLLNMLVVPAALLHFGTRRVPSAAVVAPVVLAAGCASVDPTPDWQSAAQIVGDGRAAVVRTPDEEPFDTAIQLADGELTRDECVAIVLGSHPRLEGAFHDIGVSRAELAQAGLLSNPALSMFFLFPEGGGRTQLQGTIAASLADLWLIPARERAAQADLDRAVLEAARLAGELIVLAAGAHDRALEAERYAELARETAAIARISEARATERAGAGAGRMLDVQVAGSERLQADLAVAALEAHATAARGELFRRLALAGDFTALRLVGELPGPGSNALDVELLVARALERRLDLRALRSEAESLRERIPLERRRAWPDVEIALHAERPDEGPTIRGPGATVEIPIFDRGDAAVARAEAAYRGALARTLALAHEVEQEVRGAWATVCSAQEALELARGSLVGRAEATADLAERAHAAGDASFTTLHAAQQGRVRARQAALDAEIAASRARASLERAAGLPWTALTGG